jgi:hypothetical protein
MKAIDTHFYGIFDKLQQKILEFFENIAHYKHKLEKLIS